jgi:hypothetical protein
MDVVLILSLIWSISLPVSLLSRRADIDVRALDGDFLASTNLLTDVIFLALN